jgi:hypothetical protein
VSSSFAFFANEETGIREVFVGRNFQVDWRRNTFENAGRHVELGAVARAEEATWPVSAKVGWSNLLAIGGRAPQVRADSNSHQYVYVLLDGARFVLAVFGLL